MDGMEQLLFIIDLFCLWWRFDNIHLLLVLPHHLSLAIWCFIMFLAVTLLPFFFFHYWNIMGRSTIFSLEIALELKKPNCKWRVNTRVRRTMSERGLKQLIKLDMYTWLTKIINSRPGRVIPVLHIPLTSQVTRYKWVSNHPSREIKNCWVDVWKLSCFCLIHLRTKTFYIESFLSSD